MTEIPQGIQWLAETGLSTALLGVLIWVIQKTLKQFNETTSKAFQTMENIVEKKDAAVSEITKVKDQQVNESFEAHKVLSGRMLDMMQKMHDEEMEQKDLLIRYLDRIQTKVEEGVSCPANYNFKDK